MIVRKILIIWTTVSVGFTALWAWLRNKIKNKETHRVKGK